MAQSPTVETGTTRDLELWRAQLLRIMLRVLAAAGLLPLLAALYDSYTANRGVEMLLRGAIYLGLLALTFWPGISYQVQVVGLMVFFGGFATWNLTQYGVNAESSAMFLTLPIIAVLFLGLRAGRWAIAAILLAIATMAWFFVTGRIIVYNYTPVRSTDLIGWLIHGFVFFGLSLGLVFAENYVLRRLGTALRDSRRLTRELQAARASLEGEVTERTRNLVEARAAAEGANEALQEQMWLVAGQARLNELMRGELGLTALVDNVIRHLCQYAEVPVGALYLREEDRVRRLAVYAYTPSGNQPAFLRLGEGLVGQAAQDGKIHYLSDVPEANFTIASGLGHTPPRHILVVPFRYEGEVIGVLELGSWQALTESQRRFFEQARESIAIAFNTAQNRERIARLLEETQRQTQALQAQEEELRAINEELEAQAEHLAQELEEST